MSARAESAFRPEDLPIVVAHRGLALVEPENTLAAFEAAVACGAQAVEFDVRLTLDGHPVVIHDADTLRVCGGEGGPVCAMALRDLKRLRVRSRSGEPAEIPTLAEALALLSGRIGIDIEIKNLPGEPDYSASGSASVESIGRALDAAAFSGPVLVSSFDPPSLATARSAMPGVPTGLLSTDAVPAGIARELTLREGHDWVLPSLNAVRAAGPGFFEEVHGCGLLVGTWVVDDAREARTLFSSGIDAIATNDPASLVRAHGGRTDV